MAKEASTPALASLARIAVVDANRFDREFAREVLIDLGCVDVFESADAFVERLALVHYDLVISGLVMPGMSGIELFAHLRREASDTDFVLLTGDATVESAIAALRMGALDYLQKPVSEEQLQRVAETALQGRALFEENRRLRDALRTVEACRALAPCLEPGEVYPVALDLLLATVRRRRGVVVFRRAPLPTGDGVVFRGLEESEALRLRAVLAERKAIDLDAKQEIGVQRSGEMHDALRHAQISAGGLLSVAIRGREREVGFAWLFDEGHDFSPEELELVKGVQRHAAAALNNAERHGRAKERAFIDDVTEIYNARYLLSATANEIQRAERYGNPLSVLFLDIDRFKLVNDQHGHLVGSQTLRVLSGLLMTDVRQVDTLARYGGDEFTVLLVDTGHAAATAIAERIRQIVEEALFEVGGAASLRLTVSVGVASYPEHGVTRDELLDAADKAMYRAKSLGRNRVCSADQLSDG